MQYQTTELARAILEFLMSGQLVSPKTPSAPDTLALLLFFQALGHLVSNDSRETQPLENTAVCQRDKQIK
jgi:hypothetical protein